MMTSSARKIQDRNENSNDNYCGATLDVSTCGRQVSTGIWAEHNGCIFKVGNEMYFVPTKQVADEDMLYITCDAQKIEGSMDGWRSHLSLGDSADHSVEDAILGHLHKSRRQKKPQGEAFVITRDGKTFRL